MRLGIAQTQPLFGCTERNIEDAFTLMETAPADLWVLPEFFASGYLFASRDEVRSLAEPVPEGPTVHALARFCRDHDCSIVAGLPESTSEGVFNSAVLVGPEGWLAVYRKVHLFGLEKEWFLPGNLPFAVHAAGSARVGLMVCFDHLFPEAARTLALLGADLLAHPANLVLPDLAQQTMTVRAIENGVFAATANRVGEETRAGITLRYTGRSQVVGPRGDVLARLSPDRCECASVDVDLANARDKSLTRHNDKLADRRPAFYHLGPPDGAAGPKPHDEEAPCTNPDKRIT